MTPFQNQINSALSPSDNLSVIELFLRLLASTVVHLVEDEHWCYFDNYYSPDYICMSLFNSFKEAINAGRFPPEEVKMLCDGLLEIASLEAVQDYGYLGVERWLKNDCFTFHETT